MTVIIPNTKITYRGKNISLGEEMQLEAGQENSKNNPLFKLMLKMLIAPVSLKQNVNVEKHSKIYLNADKMELVAKENSGIRFNKKTYQKFIDSAWNLLSEISIEDFLEEILSKQYHGIITEDDKSKEGRAINTFKEIKSDLTQPNITLNQYVQRNEFVSEVAFASGNVNTGLLWESASNNKPYSVALQKIINNVDDYSKIDVIKTNNAVNSITIDLEIGKLMEEMFKEAGLEKYY